MAGWHDGRRAFCDLLAACLQPCARAMLAHSISFALHSPAHRRNSRAVSIRAVSSANKMQPSTLFIASGYLVTCSLLLIANKVCVQAFPAPATVHVVQFAFSAAGPCVMFCLGTIHVLDGFDAHKVRPSVMMAIVSSSAMYFNMMALRTSDVSTILVVRACCPIVDSVIEHFCFDRALPSLQGCLMLCLVAMSAAGYMVTMEHQGQGGAGPHLLGYFVWICASDTFGKWIVSGLKWDNKQWGPVLYSNAIAIPYQLAIAVATHEFDSLDASVSSWRTPASAGVLLVTCILGLSISYFGWRCRDAVSATAFALLGISNKILSLLAAALLWEPPNVKSVCFLLLCLVAALLYAHPQLIAEAVAGAVPKASAGACATAGATTPLQSVKDGIVLVAPSSQQVLRTERRAPRLCMLGFALVACLGASGVVLFQPSGATSASSFSILPPGAAAPIVNMAADSRAVSRTSGSSQTLASEPLRVRVPARPNSHHPHPHPTQSAVAPKNHTLHSHRLSTSVPRNATRATTG